MYNAFKSGKLESNSNNIEQYHRRNLTEKLADLIKKPLS